jgi:hypothetical protein
MLTTWGDRATSKEAAQKLITTLVDWEVLCSTKLKGHFLLARKVAASIPDLQLWLLEALLGASAADEIEAHQLLRLPESFPFITSVGMGDLRRYEGFNIHRQGLDMDMVALRKVKLEQQPKTAKKPKNENDLKSAQPSLFDMSENVVSNTAKPDTVPAVPVTIPSVDEQQAGMDEGRRNEDSIKNEILQTRSNRAIRFPQVQGTILVSEGPFAAPSVECAEHFRGGHYFGCIALTQAVLEAVIRHAWQRKLKKKPNQESSFDKNLEALHKRRFITDEWKTKLNQMWAERHSFQHLRPSVESDQKTLEEKARKNLNLLNELEQTFFSAKLPARLRFGRLLIQDSDESQ